MGQQGTVLGFQVVPEALEVVGLAAGAGHGVHHVVHDGAGVDPVRLLLRLILPGGHHGRHHGGHIHGFGLDIDGVGGEGVLLDPVDIGLDAGGEGEDQGDADDADGPGQGGEHRAALFGQQVVQGEPQGRGKGHGGQPLVLMLLGGGGSLAVIGGGVGDDFAVQQPHNPRGVALGQLGVVGDHDDQPVPGDLL